MKKISWILAIFAMLALLFAGCGEAEQNKMPDNTWSDGRSYEQWLQNELDKLGGGGGGGGNGGGNGGGGVIPTMPTIFNGTNWAVGFEATLEWEDDSLKDGIIILFDNPAGVDLSAYAGIHIQTNWTSDGYWHGYQLGDADEVEVGIWDPAGFNPMTGLWTFTFTDFAAVNKSKLLEIVFKTSVQNRSFSDIQSIVAF